MYTSNAYNVYKNNSVNFASKEQLFLMLLDGSVKFSKIARQAIEDKDIEKTNNNLIKTQNIFYELIASLDIENSGQMGKNLVNLYDFIIIQLREANIKKDVKILDETIPLMEEIRDMWNEAYEISKKSK